jgi:Rad3-related DNA helicase
MGRVTVLHAGEPGGETQVAAVALEGDAVAARFSAAVGADLPADLAALLASDTLCLSHDAAAARRFLADRFTADAAPLVLDTIELSRICFPALPDHSLPSLASHLHLPPPADDGPAELSDALARLWPPVARAAAGLPPAILREMRRLLASGRRDPMRRFLDACAIPAGPSGGPRRFEDLLQRGPPAERRRPTPEGAERAPVAADSVAAVFEPGGPLEARSRAYEHREEQVAMARAVAEAFNGSHILLVEAGTGVGKSLAYLVPAALWASANGAPVVVSTNTKNLQAQLFEKDLPLLREVLGVPFRAALIKGRRNYLCARKLSYLLRTAGQDLDRTERGWLAAVLPWAAGTDTGDFAETFMEGRAEFAPLAARLSSAFEECAGPECPRRQVCFLYRARRRALAADIVVANHSVVFAEMGLDSPVLPPYSHVVFDEAHNLEAAATTHFTVEVSETELRSVFSRLARGGGRRSHGVLPAVMRRLETKTRRDPDAPVEDALRDARELSNALVLAESDAPLLFRALRQALDARGGHESRRIRPEDVSTAEWQAVVAAGQRLAESLGAIAGPARRLAASLRDAGPPAGADGQDVAQEIEATALRVQEAAHDISFVVKAAEEGHVFWVERDARARSGAAARAAPVEIGPRLAESLFDCKETVVFTSATLTVRGSMEFLKRRLGLGAAAGDRRVEVSLGTPFDYRRQCFIAVPAFLPDPAEGAEDYSRQLASLLDGVLRVTRGRAMALFTSYDMLRRVWSSVSQSMAGTGIRVLAQGISGSRESLADALRSDMESVIMGTHSFWEGVDIVGEALSCLVLARLPFAVHTEPIVEARCERLEAAGEDSFTGYTLPGAVIRFRQGFGRLIRHRDDRGVVIVADRRIVSKRYGAWFRDSVPAPLVPFTAPEPLLAALESFLSDPPA